MEIYHHSNKNISTFLTNKEVKRILKEKGICIVDKEIEYKLMNKLINSYE